MLATYHDTDTYFALNDWLGTKRAEVNSTLTCANIYQSLPFGDGFNPGGSTPCPDATEHYFTGKERDAESGNDYFDARYYSSSMGRFLSPDWSAQVSPVPYAKLDDPQTLDLYAYVGNNPLSRTDPTGHEIVQLGVHTDDEIKQETKEINAQLKVKGLSKEQRDALKAVKNTLGLEKEGNHVAGAYLSALDSIGQRNGLQLSDIKLTTDSAHDFSSMGLSDAQTARITNPNTQAFVLNRSGSMYLKSETTLFRNLIFNLSSTKVMPYFRPTVTGWLTLRTSRGAFKSISRHFPAGTANGRSHGAAVTSRNGIVREARSITSHRAER